MSSVKDISEALIKIAYADKNDRIEMMVKLAKDFQNVPYSEIPQVQQELIKEIFEDLNEEVSNDKIQQPSGEAQKPVKAKATKPIVAKPQPQLKLSNLKKGDMFRFPLSEEDLQMGVGDVIYTFDTKIASSYFYKSEFGNFHYKSKKSA